MRLMVEFKNRVSVYDLEKVKAFSVEYGKELPILKLYFDDEIDVPKEIVLPEMKKDEVKKFVNFLASHKNEDRVHTLTAILKRIGVKIEGYEAEDVEVWED